MLVENGLKNTISIGNNNSEVNVIVNENNRELREENAELSAYIVWANQQLKMKDVLIEQLLKKLKSRG